MKCQNCGNELAPNEVFCGQCGAPNNTPAQQTEMMQQAPPSGARSGLLGTGYQGSGPSANQSSQLFASENIPQSNQSTIRQGPQQAGGFYQDATESFSSVAGGMGNYPPGTYTQQGFPGNAMPGGYSGQFGTQQQPFASGNYVNQNAGFPSTSFPTSQFGQGGYGSGAGLPGQQPEKQPNVPLIVGIVCLVFAIIAVGTLGTLFALRGSGNNNPQAQVTATVQPTTAPTATPSPTATPTPSPTPTPAATPTPSADPNFGWCTGCTQFGFQVEFPDGWTQSNTQDGYGFTFSDNQQQYTFASFKTPSGVPSSVNNLISADASEFQQTQSTTLAPISQPTPLDTPIGGQSWTYQSFLYQVGGQPIQLNIYATINQSKGYVIELVAPQSQFPTIQGQYYNQMITRFQFVTPTQ